MLCMSSASERDAEYKRQVEAYLLNVQLAKNWSQSEIARQAGIHPSAINKAFARKHSLGYEVLMALEAASGVEIPLDVRNAARMRRQRGDEAQTRIEAFLDRSPYWRRVLEIAAELEAEEDTTRKRALEKERDDLLTKLAHVA